MCSYLKMVAKSGREKKKKVSDRQKANRLVHGRDSKQFQGWLKKKGLPTIEELRQVEVVTIDDMREKVRLLEKYNQETEIILQYFKNVGRRGMEAIDSLGKLHMQLLELEEKLKLQGLNPLESKEYQDALKQKLELMKFLERIKFDKQKAAAEWSLKKQASEDDVEL